MGCCCLDKNYQKDENYQFTKDNPSNVYTKDKIKIEANSWQSQKKGLHQKSIQQLKQQGKQFYKKKDYKMAIICYQQGLELPNHDVSFYSNLALAFKMNKQFSESIKIIQKMNTMKSLRSHQNAQFYRKGQIIKSRCIIILVKQYCLNGDYTIIKNQNQLKEINSAIIILQELLLVPNTQNELKGFLESGYKVKQFLTEQIIPHSKVQTIQNYLTKKLRSVKEQGEIFEHYYSSNNEILAQIKKMVRQQKQHALQGEKDYLIDPITYQMFQSPVVTPSGQTYDQKMLKQHFKNNGYKDPITKQIFPLGEVVIVKNNNLKSYMTEYRTKINKQDLQLINI